MDGEDMTVKARMLKLLEQHENELISGEAAAAELNCTRAAIWKAVKSLREEGYTENWILQTGQPRRLHFQEKQAMAH